MESYRNYTPFVNTVTPSSVKRVRTGADFNHYDISAYQSPNLASSKTPRFSRRSSIAYFADEASMKVDMSFDSDEIFRPENVLNIKRPGDVQQQQQQKQQHQQQQQQQQQDSSLSRRSQDLDMIRNTSTTLSPFSFPFSSSSSSNNNKSNTVTFPHTSSTRVVSEGEDDPRSVAIPSPPLYHTFLAPLTSSSTLSVEQHQYNQYPTMMMATNNNKRKEMELPFPSPPSKVRFRSHQAESWMEKYEELLDFRLKNGHCLVPNQFTDNPSLAEWVKRQRYQYKLKVMGKHSSMSDDRVVALEKLGFVWNSHDAVWEERLKELKQYKHVFGNTNVPSKYEPNPQLAIWIKRQRRQYKFLTEGKPSTMTPCRVELLRGIDFSWSGRKPKV